MSGANNRQVPPGWVAIQIGEILSFHYGKGLPENGRRCGGVPVFGSNGPVGFHDQALIEGPAIIVGRKGTVGAVHLVGSECWPIDTTYYINNFTGLDPKFAFHKLTFIKLGQFDKSTAIPGISRDDVYAKEFLFCPLLEQERIADALDELLSDLDAGVASLERVRDKLKLYRAAVLKAAVEGALTVEWRKQHPQTEPDSELLKRILAERRRRWEEEQLRKFKDKSREPPKNWKAKYKEPFPVNTTDLPVLPEGWSWTNLDTLIVQGPQNGLYLPNTFYGRGVEILRIDDFQNGWVRPRDQLKRIEANEEAIMTYGLHTRDLVINRVNSMTHLGKCCVAIEEFEGVLFESNMMRVEVASVVDAQYVELYLRSEFGRRRLTKDAKWAVNQASINQQDVKRTPIPLPPFAEQEAIVEEIEDQFSIVNHIESDLDAKVTGAQTLRQSILRHAFAGKLVPQDPKDEPATELLKRIAAKREQRAREMYAAKRVARRKLRQPGRTQIQDRGRSRRRRSE